jgi:hypothetical protein
MGDYMENLNQTVVHQLREAANKIENGNGIVSDFDYEEEVHETSLESSLGNNTSYKERSCQMELEFLLPE